MLSEATPRDAAAIATLHAASFHRGWSEDEIDRLLIERNVLTHRATVNGRLVGFIMSRIAAGEAEILSVAVRRPSAARGWRGGCSICTCGRLAGLGTRVVFLEVDEGQCGRRGGSTAAPASARSAAARATIREPTASRSTALVLRRDLGVTRNGATCGRWISPPGRDIRKPRRRP